MHARKNFDWSEVGAGGRIACRWGVDPADPRDPEAGDECHDHSEKGSPPGERTSDDLGDDAKDERHGPKEIVRADSRRPDGACTSGGRGLLPGDENPDV